MSPPLPGVVVAVSAGLRHARACWRPLLLVLTVQLLLGLVVAVPVQQRLSDRLDGHPHAAALAGAPTEADRALGWEAGMDAGLWRDVRRELSGALDGLTVALALVLVLAWGFGAVAAGGFLGLLREPGPASAGRFLSEGGRWFGRMLRVGLCVAVALFLAARVVYEGWGAAVKDAERAAATSEAAWWGERAREVTLLAALLVLRVVGDLARADLVRSGRRSAFLACLRAAGRVLRHPVRTLGAAALIGAPGFGLLYGLAALHGILPGGGWLGVGLLFVVLQAAVLVRWVARAATLAALAQVACPPPARPRAADA